MYSVALENSEVAWKAMTRPFEISAPGSVLCYEPSSPEVSMVTMFSETRAWAKVRGALCGDSAKHGEAPFVSSKLLVLVS